jgi:hypothetical protein
MRRAPAVSLAVAVLIGCASPANTPRRDWLARLAAAPIPPAGRNWPVPPAQIEELAATGSGVVRERNATSGGVTGAERFTIYFPKIDRTIDLKWKAAPPGDADGWNNNPRKELAAYAIQKWFLPPEAYVAPTAVGRCYPVAQYRRLEPEAKPTLPGTQCVFGIHALWLENVEVPETLYDEERFHTDAAYARHLANFNLFTYIIEDRDTRPSNVLTSKDRANRRVFSVDNGISFDPLLYNYFVNGWQDIRVPALPRASIDRLRRVTPERAHELAVVAQFKADKKGILRPVPPGPPIDPKRGVRFRDGVLQLGLTDDEIEHVWKRVEQLLADVDTGRIPLF